MVLKWMLLIFRLRMPLLTRSPMLIRFAKATVNWLMLKSFPEKKILHHSSSECPLPSHLHLFPLLHPALPAQRSPLIPPPPSARPWPPLSHSLNRSTFPPYFPSLSNVSQKGNAKFSSELLIKFSKNAAFLWKPYFSRIHSPSFCGFVYVRSTFPSPQKSIEIEKYRFFLLWHLSAIFTPNF